MKLLKEIYRYCNPHPQKKLVGDCVVRAITIALDGDYLEVRKHLNRVKKELKETSYKNNKFIHKYAQLMGWDKISFPAIKGVPRLRGRDFVKKYPKGKYILNLAGHIVTVVDGVYFDIWDCTDKMIYNAWEIK